MASPMTRRRRGWSVRARSAGAAAAVVALALVVVSLALLVVLRESVVSTAVTTAASRARDVATELVADGRITTGVNLAGAGSRDQALVQLLAGGEVVEATEGFHEAAPLVTEPVAPDVVVDLLAPAVEDRPGGPYVGVALGVDGVSDVDTVVVLQSYAAGEDTVEDAARALLVAGPVLVVLVGVTTYLLTGRALRPIELIRRRTEQITDADEDARIDVPASGDEVEALARTLNDMLERLHAAQVSQVRFLADASHELRSPLAAIRAELDVAERSPDAADWPRTATVVRRAGDRMHHLVDDLLVLTRTGERSAADRRADVDLDAVVEEVGFGLRAPSGITVHVRTQPVKVIGSQHELTRAVANLVENAARHATGRIGLGVCQDGGWAVLEVDDDGPGVPSHAREQVFERFARLDDARTRAAGGAGLGLAIVRGIATAHGGTVAVTDSDLGGARFVLRLPALLFGQDDVTAEVRPGRGHDGRRGTAGTPCALRTRDGQGSS